MQLWVLSSGTGLRRAWSRYLSLRSSRGTIRQMRDMTTRRDFLKNAAATVTGTSLAFLFPVESRATPEAMQDAIRKIVGEGTPQHGRVNRDEPPRVEHGHTV